MNYTRLTLLGAALCVVCCLFSIPCHGANDGQESYILIEDSFAPDIAQHIVMPEYALMDYTPTYIRVEGMREIVLPDNVAAQVALCTLSQDGQEADLLMLVVHAGEKSDYRWLDRYPNDLELFFADVDGDGAEEIITHQFNGGNGGFGQYDSFALKITEHGLQELGIPYYAETGFTLDVEAGFTYVIRNAHTGFEFSFVETKPNNFAFDASGNLLEHAKEFFSEDVMLLDTYFVFEPVDVDQDGVFEIMTAQYCSGPGSHNGDYNGSAYTILRYDAEAGAMKVVRAGFWPEQPHMPLVPWADEEECDPAALEYYQTWYLSNIPIEDSLIPDIVQHIGPLHYAPELLSIVETHEIELPSGVIAKVRLCELEDIDGHRATTVLAAHVGEKSFFCLLSEERVYASLAFADIDGDGIKEIIIHQENGGTGGFGQYDSFVFRITELGLQALDIPDFAETGFTFEAGNGFMHVVRNTLTGFSTSFVRKERIGSVFDERGGLLENADCDFLLVDSFYMFAPIDEDGDGMFEIMAAQYCSLVGHTDYVGSAFTIFRYDAQAGALKVMRSGFWPEEPEDMQDSNEPSLEQYSETWYQ